DRGLDQARAELAQQLPKHIMAVPGEVQRYIDRLKTNRTKLQKYADYTKPLHDYDQNVATFRAQHGTTLAEANQAAHQASQQANQPTSMPSRSSNRAARSCISRSANSQGSRWRVCTPQNVTPGTRGCLISKASKPRLVNNAKRWKLSTGRHCLAENTGSNTTMPPKTLVGWITLPPALSTPRYPPTQMLSKLNSKPTRHPKMPSTPPN